MAAAALGLGMLVLLAVAALLWHERQRILDEGARSATRLAHVLEQQTLREFQAVDLTLVGIADALRLTPALPPHDPGFQLALQRMRGRLPHVRALYVIGPDGFIVHDTDYPRTPPVSLADRGYFLVHARDPHAGLHVTPPLISRSVGTWFVGLSRRIDTRNGRFGGVVAAALDPRSFERFYKDLNLAAGDSIGLFGRDGTLIARSPRAESLIGRSFADLDLFRERLRASPAGTYRTTSVAGGRPVLVGYRVVPDLPLVVTVALREDALLAGWRRTAAGAAGAAALLAVMLNLIAVLLVRQIRQQALQRARLAHAQKLEALGRMTGGIAHDFGNILSAVVVNLEVLRRRAAVDERIRQPVEGAVRAVARGMALASQLLAFARRQELRIEACDAGRLVRDMEPLLRQAAGARVDVEVEVDDAVWPCRADQSQLGVALLNLVANARDAMPDGAGHVRIRVSNHRVDPPAPPAGFLEQVLGAGPRTAALVEETLAPGDYVRITIVDDGEGMAPDVLRHATEPFFTTKGEGKGTGLGLSQVYGFVHQVGGDLRIESGVGAGTAVHLLFQRAEDHPVPAERAAG